MHYKKLNLSLRSFEKVATCQRITSKTSELSGSIPEPAIRSGDTGQQKHYFDSCHLIKTWMYNIRLQAPKLARKCELNIGMPVVRTDGRSGPRCRSRDCRNF